MGCLCEYAARLPDGRAILKGKGFGKKAFAGRINGRDCDLVAVKRDQGKFCEGAAGVDKGDLIADRIAIVVENLPGDLNARPGVRFEETSDKKCVVREHDGLDFRPFTTRHGSQEVQARRCR